MRGSRIAHLVGVVSLVASCGGSSHGGSGGASGGTIGGTGGTRATGGATASGGNGGASNGSGGVAGGGTSGGHGGGGSGGTSGSGGRAGAGGAGGNAATGGAAGKAGGGGSAGASGSGGVAGAGGKGGAAGVGGKGGALAVDAGAGGCGRPAQTYTFKRVDVRPLTVNSLNAGLVFAGSSGTPTLIYLGGALSQARIWAAHLPDASDAGVSVSLAYQISRGELGGGTFGMPQVRTATTGEIRVAYLEGYNGQYTARYITWNGDFNQTPSDTTVGSYNLGFAPPIGFGLDPQDHPGLVTFPTDNTILFSKNDGSGWQMTTLATRNLEGLAAAVAFDGNGVASVFWNADILSDAAASGFAVANPGTSGWSSAAFDPQTSGAQTLIAGRDGRGQVEIVYNGASGYLRAVGTAGAWTLGASMPVQNSVFGEPAAVAFGAGGELHLAYVDNIQGVMYAYFDGCSWSTQVVDADTTVGDDVQIALDPSGVPHLSYQAKSILAKINGGPGELWYASPTR